MARHRPPRRHRRPAGRPIAPRAGLGLLIGAFAAFPVTGLAASGLLTYGLASRGQLARRVRQFTGAIKPGMSALFVLGKTADAERLRIRLQPFLVGANCLQTSLATDPPELIVGDGEIWGETLLSARVLPGVMRVVVP